ncbi:hypothetical protein [Algoriphagus sp.]|uniref:hypothetical protein n=1 Tax=Algoriphagus sp. TaxID=1872435 RepID=UPI00272295F4|nr:hypothetical protein [Algoriphagus sp.]MDO8967120.1 hypothetical protein [Algoriphagus sp.]MDP3199386.1 hypothetical protein [Algoriphagus sp.]
MKKLIIVLFIAGAFFSCNQEDGEPDIRNFNGEMTVLFNGEEWKSPIRFYLQKQITCSPGNSIIPLGFGFAAYDESGYFQRILDLGFILPTTEIQSAQELLKNTAQNNPNFANTVGQPPRPGYITTIGYDAISTVYLLDSELRESYFQLTHYDSDKKEIHGVFELEFFLSSKSSSEPNAPDRIKFTQGKFVAKAPEEWFQWDKKCDPR